MPSSSPLPGQQPSGTPRPAGLSRRGFAALAGTAAASAALAVPTATATATAAPVREEAPARVPRPPADRPNILWLVAEDHYPFLGSYGDRTARTPTLDRLAREGIRYEHSYSSAPVCAPSRFALLSGVHPQSAGPAEHMRALGRVPDFLRGFPEYLRRAGYHCTNNSKTDYNTVVDMGATWDESSATAHWRDRPAGAPFFAVINDMTTHESSLFTARDGRTRPSEVRLPAYLPDTPEIRADLAHYYDAMEALDGRIAARLAELETAGLAEDTVVFFYSDNGGVLPRSKRHCYDEGMRTALIVRIPEKWAHLAPRPAGSVEEGAVTSVDYGPTVLALAGVEIPDHVQGRPFLGVRRPRPAPYAFGGRDRMDERYDMVRTARDTRYRYLRNYAPHRPWGQHQAFAWLAKGYQSWEREHLAGRLDTTRERFWRPKPHEELYDLRADPDQVRNLAGDPRHAGTLRRLSRALDEHILRVNDNGFIPEGSPLEGWEASRKPGAYPLRRVLDLAGRAIERDPRHLPALVRALDDRNEVVRHWGAQGLLILDRRAAPAAGRLARTLRHDPSPQVRIGAAESLAHLGHRTDEAVAFLARTLDEHADPFVRLQAINALTFIDTETARPARAAVEAAALSTNEYLRNAGRYLKFVLDGTYTPSSRVFDPVA
ncbi:MULTISPECIES: sulfatase-like hydrolase/transferase [unclassified Streptomyces]|uniref:sulfatase-like hydrolase/transferase n=1 Tax=unclassified Streptomyces TaxID=2593676 RepID=UPI0006B05CDB|nr:MULTISPECIES: sulfatase-like hydrolase/transferase [unclassified Streptomyces]KOX19457.1 sulfatase [Streptomyces sp. NRRL F-6491]KOX48304.1 sulfatase [Streptomyces sp. NRRL F-6492]